MGSGKKKAVTGYRYRMSLHLAVCYGTVDKVIRFICGDREAWAGEIDSNQTVAVDAPDLFGGDAREGGLKGTLTALLGGSAQTLPAVVSGSLPADAPAFRGVLSLFYKGQISANNPYVKPMAVQVERIKQGWAGAGCWYPAKAPVPLSAKLPGAADGPPQTVLLNFDGVEDGGVPYAKDEHGIDLAEQEYGRAVLGYYNGDGRPGGQAWGVTLSEHARAIGSSMKSPCPDCYGNFAPAAAGSGSWAVGTYKAGVTFFDIILGPGMTLSEISFWYWTAGAGSSPGVVFLTGEVMVSWATLPIGPVGKPWTWYEKRDLAGQGINKIRISGSPNMVVADMIELKFDRAADTFMAMNPAHIIYQCLTDPVWGMGYPTAIIDEASFTAAADTLHAEGLGLCMLWNQSEEIGTFVGHVLDHAGAVLFTDPSTGKFRLKLLRADYVPGTLPVYDETKIIALEGFQRAGYADTVNEITVVYRDVVTNRDATVTVQNLANIQAQGAVVGQTRQYPGLPTPDLALRVAQRDLDALSTPLAKCKLKVNRTAWSLTPGAVFRLSWARLGLTAVVMRVLGIDIGTLEDGTIAVECAEDVFGLPANSYAAQEPAGWEEPSTAPQPVAQQTMIEAPYYVLARTMAPADLAGVDADAAYFGALAGRPSGTSTGFAIESRVGGVAFESRGEGAFVPAGLLDGDLPAQSTSVVLKGAIDFEQIAAGMLLQVGAGRSAELMLVTSADPLIGIIVVQRGVIDTTPRAHADAAPVWAFATGLEAPEDVERATGETIDYRLIPSTTGGTLSPGLATPMQATAQQRQYRPLAPGRVRINGQEWPDVAHGRMQLTWAHRDRLQQTAGIVPQSDGDIGPEAGTSYEAAIYDDTSGALIDSIAGTLGTTWEPVGYAVDRMRIEIGALRGGLDSWHKQVRVLPYTGSGGLVTEAGDTVLAESGDCVVAEATRDSGGQVIALDGPSVTGVVRAGAWLYGTAKIGSAGTALVLMRFDPTTGAASPGYLTIAGDQTNLLHAVTDGSSYYALYANLADSTQRVCRIGLAGFGVDDDGSYPDRVYSMWLSGARSIAHDGADLWAAASFASVLSRLDASTLDVADTYSISGGVCGVAFDGADLWVACETSAEVARVAAADGTELARFSTGVASPAFVAPADGVVVVCNGNACCAHAAATGTELAQYAITGWPVRWGAYVAGVYSGAVIGQRRVILISATTGLEAGEVWASGDIAAGTVGADGDVLYLRRLDPATFDPRPTTGHKL